MRQSYFYNRNPDTRKTASLYWDAADNWLLELPPLKEFHCKSLVLYLIRWPLGDVAVILKGCFSNSLYRILALTLTVRLLLCECHRASLNKWEVSIGSDNALKWMPWDLTDDKSALVQVMAWCREATSHYLRQCWPRSMSPNGVLGLNELNVATTPGVHFTYDFFLSQFIQWKFHYALIQILMKWLPLKFCSWDSSHAVVSCCIIYSKLKASIEIKSIWISFGIHKLLLMKWTPDNFSVWMYNWALVWSTYKKKARPPIGDW